MAPMLTKVPGRASSSPARSRGRERSSWRLNWKPAANNNKLAT